MKRRWLVLLTAGALALGLLSGCFGKTPDPTPEAQSPTPTPTVTPDDREKVNVAVLNGPTGMGAAQLMALSETGETKNDYTFTVFTANDQVNAALTNQEVDIAAIATNVAANYYNKTGGSIQMAAINTLGVLKILQSGLEPGGQGAITSLRELEGQTLYATGEGANPEYVLNYLLSESGLDPKTDVDIQWMTPEEVSQGMLSGKTSFAMLPVPAANVLMSKNLTQSDSRRFVYQALDLTEEWKQTTSDGELTMGCVVVRAEYAQEHPQAVRDFLAEYEASITYMTDPESMAVSTQMNPAQLLEKYGLAPAAVAAEALEQANLTFVSGADNMRDVIQGYYEVLYAANPDSIGGGIPDDAFYFE